MPQKDPAPGVDALLPWPNKHLFDDALDSLDSALTELEAGLTRLGPWLSVEISTDLPYVSVGFAPRGPNQQWQLYCIVGEGATMSQVEHPARQAPVSVKLALVRCIPQLVKALTAAQYTGLTELQQAENAAREALATISSSKNDGF
jgi:hypothetical protein